MQNERLDQQSLLPLKALLQMGKYRIDHYLSSGGFGNTYVITNIQFEEQFAMKEFFMKGINERNGDNTTISVSNKTNRPQFEQQREKFKKEARRLRKLHNRHIVQVHDLFEENGTAYYVMDFVDGESLSTRLKRTKKPLSEQEALSVLSQSLDALRTVHEEDIWHLDLKPANIMVDKSGHAVLIDFGASKQMSTSEGYTTTTTAMCYTQGYASPEQIDQNMELIGPWTDLYALGATLYNLLTCNQPPSVSEMFGAKAFLFPKPVSDKTQYLVRWMMNPNREKRPQSVEEVRRFLEKPFQKENVKEDVSLDDDELTQMPDAPKEKKQPESSNRKKWMPFAAVAAVLGIGIVVFFAMRGGEETVTNADKEPATRDALVELSSSDASQRVDKMYFDSALGICSYTGPVDGNRKPHGIGEVSFTDGRLYRGPFVHGKFDGVDAYFKYDNGDTFEGSFVSNAFSKGKYTLKEDGSYFIGTFKNGQPDKGQWYDKQGNQL